MELQIALSSPSGESLPRRVQPVYFEGEDDRGVDIVVNLRLSFDVEGLYWFHIVLAGQEITRVPLRIIYLRQPAQTSALPGG